MSVMYSTPHVIANGLVAGQESTLGASVINKMQCESQTRMHANPAEKWERNFDELFSFLSFTVFLFTRISS